MNDIMKLYNKQRDESYWFQEAWEKCFWILSKVIDHKIITLDEYSPPIKITYNKNINRIYIHQNKTISEKGIDIKIFRENLNMLSLFLQLLLVLLVKNKKMLNSF